MGYGYIHVGDEGHMGYGYIHVGDEGHMGTYM